MVFGCIDCCFCYLVVCLVVFSVKNIERLYVCNLTFYWNLVRVDRRFYLCDDWFFLLIVILGLGVIIIYNVYDCYINWKSNCNV